jgi:acyl carrier protein
MIFSKSCQKSSSILHGKNDHRWNGRSKTEVLEEIEDVVRDTLKLGARADSLTADSPLLGSLSELESMAVVIVITALEERYGFFVEDHEISAETLAK